MHRKGIRIMREVLTDTVNTKQRKIDEFMSKELTDTVNTTADYTVVLYPTSLGESVRSGQNMQQNQFLKYSIIIKAVGEGHIQTPKNHFLVSVILIMNTGKQKRRGALYQRGKGSYSKIQRAETICNTNSVIHTYDR